MIYYSHSLITGGVKMSFFRRKPSPNLDAEKEAEVQAIRKDTFKRIDKASKKIDRLNTLLDDPNLGISGMIFLATGGDKRTQK